MKVKPDALNAIGRRKESIAKVWVFKGTGEVKLNHQDPLDYLNSPRLVRSMMSPVIELNLENKYDIRIDVSGGGLTGQAEASRLALSRALLEINDDFKPTLKALGLLTQDSREKERKNMENAALEKVHNLENDKDYIFNIQTFNKIAPAGLDVLATDNFNVSDANEQADAYLLRSQSLHDHDFPQTLKAIGRAGAGVNNIPVDRCTQSGVIVFNAPGANANAVKELAIVGMLLASRDIVGGIDHVKSIADDPNISSLVENKSKFKGFELIGKRLGLLGWVLLDCKWPMLDWRWVWMSLDMIHLFRFALHGIYRVM